MRSVILALIMLAGANGAWAVDSSPRPAGGASFFEVLSTFPSDPFGLSVEEKILINSPRNRDFPEDPTAVFGSRQRTPGDAGSHIRVGKGGAPSQGANPSASQTGAAADQSSGTGPDPVVDPNPGREAGAGLPIEGIPIDPIPVPPELSAEQMGGILPGGGSVTPPGLPPVSLPVPSDPVPEVRIPDQTAVLPVIPINQPYTLPPGGPPGGGQQ